MLVLILGLSKDEGERALCVRTPWFDRLTMRSEQGSANDSSRSVAAYWPSSALVVDS